MTGGGVIEGDSYVNDLLKSHNGPKCLDQILKRMEDIQKVYCFYLKPFFCLVKVGGEAGECLDQWL